MKEGLDLLLSAGLVLVGVNVHGLDLIGVLETVLSLIILNLDGLVLDVLLLILILVILEVVVVVELLLLFLLAESKLEINLDFLGG